MNIYRIWGVMFRHLIVNFRNLLRVTDMLYWPFFDFLIWGLVGRWMQSDSGSGSFMAQLCIALILWHMTMRPVMEICFGIMEEIWNHNVFNVSVTSLKLSEWVIALVLLGIIKASIMLLISSLFVWLVFGVNIFMVGWYLIPFFIILMTSGCSIGFLVISLIVRWGKMVENLAWTLSWLFAPLSAVYVPLSVLPASVGTIVRLLPMTYVFETMRAVVSGHPFPSYYLWLGLGLGIFYLSLSLMLFVFMLNKSRARGLARL